VSLHRVITTRTTFATSACFVANISKISCTLAGSQKSVFYGLSIVTIYAMKHVSDDANSNLALYNSIKPDHKNRNFT
jgi:hypothetical protein